LDQQIDQDEPWFHEIWFLVKHWEMAAKRRLENCSMKRESIPLLLVHYKEQRLLCQIAAKVFREQVVVPLPKLLGQSRSMRSNQHIIRAPEWRICRKGLAFEYIKCRSANTPRPKRLHQRGFIHLRASAHIDE